MLASISVVRAWFCTPACLMQLRFIPQYSGPSCTALLLAARLL